MKSARALTRTITIPGLVCILWVIIAPSCMRFRVSDESAKKNFQKKGLTLIRSFLRVQDQVLHYVTTGLDSLPTIIFIHGSPGSWNAFENYLEDSDLLRNFRLISIDRPGFGYSDFGKAAHLNLQSELISKLFRVINNGKPLYLVGHSLGGPMVVKLAAENPRLINAIVILSGSLDPAEEASEWWRKVLGKTPLYYFVPGAFRPSNRELLYFKDDVYSLADDFDKVTCRVYLVHGNADKWVPPGNVAYAAQKLVNTRAVEVHMLEGANHFIPRTRYNEIKTLLMSTNRSE
jgi:pimeloyl-ACP methyl ester carboxylesterase